MSEELKECPFCGGPAVNVAGEYITCGAPFFVSCAGREVRADIEDWNTRATRQARTYADDREAIGALAIHLAATANADQEEHGEWTWRDIASAAIRLLSQGEKA